MYKSKKLHLFLLGATSQIFYCCTKQLLLITVQSEEVTAFQWTAAKSQSWYSGLVRSILLSNHSSTLSLVHRLHSHFHIQPYFLLALQNITASSHISKQLCTKKTPTASVWPFSDLFYLFCYSKVASAWKHAHLLQAEK